MISVTEKSFVSEVEESDRLVVVDLWAPWCGPCVMLAPTLEELEREYPDVKFCKVNVDEEPALATMFKVDTIPFIALVKDNVFLDFSIGYVPKQKLAELIEKYK